MVLWAGKRGKGPKKKKTKTKDITNAKKGFGGATATVSTAVPTTTTTVAATTTTSSSKEETVSVAMNMAAGGILACNPVFLLPATRNWNALLVWLDTRWHPIRIHSTKKLWTILTVPTKTFTPTCPILVRPDPSTIQNYCHSVVCSANTTTTFVENTKLCYKTTKNNNKIVSNPSPVWITSPVGRRSCYFTTVIVFRVSPITWIRVGPETRHCQPGGHCLVYNTTYEHETKNESADKERVVLHVDSFNTLVMTPLEIHVMRYIYEMREAFMKAEGVAKVGAQIL